MTSASVAVAGRPISRASLEISIFVVLWGLLPILGSGLLPSFPSSSRTPSLDRTRASSLLAMSTTDTSTSLLRVTVGRVCPGFRRAGSSDSSRMSIPALTILRLPNSNCFFAWMLSGDASSNSSSPVTSPPSFRMSFTKPITIPLWCILRRTGLRWYWAMSIPAVTIQVP